MSIYQTKQSNQCLGGITTAREVDMMIHHNNTSKTLAAEGTSLFNKTKHYGVSSHFRILSPTVLTRRHDRIGGALYELFGLTIAEREVVLRLLRLWVYYGLVYPKEKQITREPGCSKATFWRTIKKLEDLGIIQRINRFLIKEKPQISNIYLLGKLVLLLVRWLAEHGQKFYEEWLKPCLEMPGKKFWGGVFLHLPGY